MSAAAKAAVRALRAHHSGRLIARVGCIATLREVSVKAADPQGGTPQDPVSIREPAATFSQRTMGRLAALDVGDKRIGVALSDPLGIVAQPIGVVERRSQKADSAAIVALLDARPVDKVIVGLPLSMNGSEGEQADKVRHFAAFFAAHTGLEVVFQDERMTTVQGERMLIESGMRRERRRQVRDTVAATIILQAYLDSMPGS